MLRGEFYFGIGQFSFRIGVIPKETRSVEALCYWTNARLLSNTITLLRSAPTGLFLLNPPFLQLADRHAFEPAGNPSTHGRAVPDLGYTPHPGVL